MIVVRGVYRAKYGRGDDLVQLFKEGKNLWPNMRFRLLTDLSGPFFTVVTEAEYENLSAWEAEARVFSDPGFPAWFERMIPLVESGQREFYTLVD